MKHFTKRIVVAAVAFALCISVAVASTALPSIFSRTAAPDRVITVDANDVLNDSFLGYGDNHWVGGEYIEGMNDSYLQVDISRIERIKPAFMRMMVHQAALIDLDASAEEQEAAWNARNYDTDNEIYKRHMDWFKIMAKAGTVIQLNYAFVSDAEYNLQWFGIEDANKNSPPKDLEAYADSCVFLIEEILKITEENGIEGRNIIDGKPVIYLSFCNETNTPSETNFPAFGDRRKYWCEMLERVHYALIDAGIRDQVYMYGTEATITWTWNLEEKFFDYVVENLVDENGEPIYDGLSTHPYAKGRTYDQLLTRLEMFANKYEGVDIATTESMAGTVPAYGTDDAYRTQAFGFGDFAQVMATVNAGWSAYGSYNFIGAKAPDYFGGAEFGRSYAAWDFPSKGLDTVGVGFLAETLGMTYIPMYSKTVKTTNTLADKTTVAKDLLSCAFIKDMDNSDVTDDQVTVIVDSDKNGERNVAVNIGSKYAGMKVERHVLRYQPGVEGSTPDQTKYYEGSAYEIAEGIYNKYDEKSYYWEDNGDGTYYLDENNELTVGGKNAIVAPTDKVITVDANGNINDTLPDEHVYILYTTIPEITQIQFEETEVEVEVGETAEFKVEKIYANGGNNGVTYSVMGKTTADAIESNNGVGWTTENCGSIDQNGVYTADNGVEAGDCVVIKAIPQADPTTYSVMIVNIK